MPIKDFIKNDLKGRLRSTLNEPQSLRLESLAGHYGVSVTPVRAALSELVAEGVLSKGRNRMVTVVERERPVQEAALSPQLVRSPRLQDIVSNDLIELALKGESTFVREEATAKRYGVSRSAIRNVFHRLSGEGLLLHVPRRGWQVRPFRPEDMHAFLEVRESLELKALELAAANLDERVLRSLLDRCVVVQNADQSLSVDNSLHAYIIDMSGNRYIRDFFDRHGRYYDILFDWEDQNRETAQETVRQHQQVIEAILRKDWQSARSALSWHIRCNHPALSQIGISRGL